MSQQYQSLVELSALLQAQVPIVWVVTLDEDRFISQLHQNVAKKLDKKVSVWSSSQGLCDIKSYPTGSKSSDSTTTRPSQLLDKIHKDPTGTNGSIYILRDFHISLVPPVIRQLKDIYESIVTQFKTIIITSPQLTHGPNGTTDGMPPTLENKVYVVEHELPTVEEIVDRARRDIDDIIRKRKEEKKSIPEALIYNDEEYKQIAAALQGLSLTEIDNALAKCLALKGRYDPLILLKDKKNIIRRSNLLEYIEPDISLNDVGGLEVIKSYINTYSECLSDKAAEFGVEPVRGILLAGPPGVGKSILPKTIGHTWRIPILKMDFGRLLGSLVGSSEARTRQAIKLLEGCAPCIAYIDEIEKALAGSTPTSGSDNGVLSRVLSTLLTAMEEGLEGVTIVATSNNISVLPPEFIRRFNEIFFVDLPNKEERWDIFSIHLSKRKRDPSEFEYAKEELLDASDKYSGAEIEKAIKAGIVDAFANKQKDVTAKNILKALREIKPVSLTNPELIDVMRNTAKEYGRLASAEQTHTSPAPNRLSKLMN